MFINDEKRLRESDFYLGGGRTDRFVWQTPQGALKNLNFLNKLKTDTRIAVTIMHMAVSRLTPLTQRLNRVNLPH